MVLQLQRLLYARAGIPEVWLLNLEEGVLEVHRGPAGQGYEEKVRLSRGQAVPVPGLPGVRLDVGLLLG